MVRFEKLLEKFLKNPTSLKFRKIEKLMFRMGFWVVDQRGSHKKYMHERIGMCFVIPVHNNECKKKYKIKLAKLINNYL